MKTQIRSVKTLPRISTLGQLRRLAAACPRHHRLMVIAAQNLGGGIKDNASIDDAFQSLVSNVNPYEIPGSDEQGVVDEVNFVRDLEADEFKKKCEQDLRAQKATRRRVKK